MRHASKPIKSANLHLHQIEGRAIFIAGIYIASARHTLYKSLYAYGFIGGKKYDYRHETELHRSLQPGLFPVCRIVPL